MFTGLVEGLGRVRGIERVGTGMRILLEAPDDHWQVDHGASVAVSGCCLTVVECRDPESGAVVPAGSPGADMVFDLSSETLDCTHFGRLDEGQVVNLERALAMGDRLGGHVVTGHVDGAGRIVAVEDSGDGGRLFHFEASGDFGRYLVDKGSVTVDGISLTIVRPEGGRFAVAVIPETLRVTTLGRTQVGDPVHLEADQLGKWVEHLLAPYMAQLEARTRD